MRNGRAMRRGMRDEEKNSDEERTEKQEGDEEGG